MGMDVRNIQLINQIKNIWTKPVITGVSGNFGSIYYTFSKSIWSVKSRVTSSGIEYKLSLKIEFPGLKEETFTELHNFLASDHVVVIQLDNGSYYQLSSVKNPLKVDSNFNLKSGIQFTFTGNQYMPIKFMSEFEVVKIAKFNYKLAFKI